MISPFRLSKSQKNKPVLYLHIRTSIKLNTKHASIWSHSLLAATQTLQQTDAAQTLYIVCTCKRRAEVNCIQVCFLDNATS
jgi:hypothetical protein